MAAGPGTRCRRRDFLKTTIATAAGWTIVKPTAVRGSQANSRLDIGVIGCGGRGRFVSRLFQQHTNTKVVALHDYFADRVQKLGDELSVDAGARFTDLDGYKRLVDLKLDAVAVESPPYFHPEQAIAALQAGKHLYLAKPMAVDVAGCLAIERAVRAAGPARHVLVDFQTRRDPLFREAAARVHRGDIGPAVLGHVYYHAGRLKPQAPEGTQTARLRNWVFDKALSGDIIVEQNIHVIDVANWYLQAHPVKAQGTGGRKARVDVGDCWDHYVVTFTYPDGVLVDFSSDAVHQGLRRPAHSRLRRQRHRRLGLRRRRAAHRRCAMGGRQHEGALHERRRGQHPGLPRGGHGRSGAGRHARPEPAEQPHRDPRPAGRDVGPRGHVGRDDERDRADRPEAAVAKGWADGDRVSADRRAIA